MDVKSVLNGLEDSDVIKLREIFAKNPTVVSSSKSKRGKTQASSSQKDKKMILECLGEWRI